MAPNINTETNKIYCNNSTVYSVCISDSLQFSHAILLLIAPILSCCCHLLDWTSRAGNGSLWYWIDVSYGATILHYHQSYIHHSTSCDTDITNVILHLIFYFLKATVIETMRNANRDSLSSVLVLGFLLTHESHCFMSFVPFLHPFSYTQWHPLGYKTQNRKQLNSHCIILK